MRTRTFAKWLAERKQDFIQIVYKHCRRNLLRILSGGILIGAHPFLRFENLIKVLLLLTRTKKIGISAKSWKNDLDPQIPMFGLCFHVLETCFGYGREEETKKMVGGVGKHAILLLLWGWKIKRNRQFVTPLCKDYSWLKSLSKKNTFFTTSLSSDHEYSLLSG